MRISLVVVMAAACSKTADPSTPPQQGQMPPAEVTVVTLKSEKVALQTELPGRTAASRAVNGSECCST